MRRIDGQIWIDREAPYRLKYHINGVDYTVLVAADYEVPEGPDGQPLFTILQGMVVKDSDKGPAMIEPASFPEDIDRVLGIALNSSNYEFLPDNADAKHIAVAQTGYIVLDKPEDVSGVSALASDIAVSQDGGGNGWGGTGKEADPPGIGAPVYWYIGHIEKISDDEYKYHDSSDQAGKITFITPSGYKYPETKITDDESLNVGYDNLHRIGTVVDYTQEEGGTKITSLVINVNFAAFDSTLEWIWPGEHFDEKCGLITPEYSNNKYIGSQIIRHGLFVDQPDRLQVINYTDIVADDMADSGSIYEIKTSVKNITSGDDRNTTVTVNTPEKMHYRISGTVHYNFDRGHN